MYKYACLLSSEINCLDYFNELSERIPFHRAKRRLVAITTEHRTFDPENKEVNKERKRRKMQNNEQGSV